MAKQESDTNFGSDEFSRIFDEYRAKIQDITRKTEKGVDIEATAAARTTEEKLEEIVVARASAAPQRAYNEVQPPQTESAEIIAEARRKARDIIQEAEDNIKKEAKKRTKAEAEKILEKARKEAEDIVAQARNSTKREKEEFFDSTKKQAESIIQELTERCRAETKSQTAQAISEAREKASKIMSDVVASSMEISRMVTEIVERARTSFSQFETTLRTETEELMKAINETQNVLHQITASSLEEESKAAEAVKNKTPSFMPGKNKESKEVVTVPTLAIRVLGEKSNGENGTQPLFHGRVEMKSVSESFDYQYLKNMKKYLVQIPNVKYLQESASEKELSVLLDLQEPLPLLEILNNIPQVNRVITEDEGISVVFNE